MIFHGILIVTDDNNLPGDQIAVQTWTVAVSTAWLRLCNYVVQFAILYFIAKAAVGGANPFRAIVVFDGSWKWHGA